VLTNLFRNWEIPQPEAESLTDALMGWMHKDHIYATGLAPQYEQAPIPYDAPERSLRSFQELAAIDTVREKFYDEDGRPNDLWKRFADAVSLLDFQRPSINGARPDTLAAVAQFDPTQQQNVVDYLHGTGMYETKGPGFFQDAGEAMRIAAGASGDTGGFSPTISALRIIITVHDGQTQFRLATVVTPQGGGASIVQTTATSQRNAASANTTPNAPNARNQNQRNPGQAPNGGGSGRPNANPNATNLKYPFTLLEIRENDEIPPAPPPPPAEPTF
jgi:general secretion pathway protein K